jgi:tetratricopeptide (TPR) repeat protein
MSALVVALMQAGEAERARALISEALAADPTDPQALLSMAELDLAAGDLPAAEAGVAAIVAAKPDSPVGHMALVRLRAGQGDLPGAEAAARAGVAAARPAAELRATLAGLLEARGDFEGAIAEWQVLYDAQPDSQIAANNLASLIADHRAQDPEALARAAAIAQRLRGSTTPEFQDTHGWIMFLTGAVEDAARSLAPAAEALPANPVVQYHFGRVLAALGRPDEARARLEAALAMAPDFAMAESARLTLAGLPQPPTGQ